VPGVGGIEFAGDAGCGERNVDDFQAAGLRAVGLDRLVRDQFDVETELLRAFASLRDELVAGWN